MTDVVITAAKRTPVRAFLGSFASTPAHELGRVAIEAALDPPLLNIVSTTDRIVPHATAPGAGERLALALGHVGMVVGSRGREALWEPLARWLSRAAAKC